MLIALYFLIGKVSELPVTLMAWLQVLMIVLAPMVVTVAGILLVCHAAGMRISQNLGATVANGIIRAIGYVAKNIVNVAIGIGRRALNLIPKVFEGSRNMFSQMGASKLVSFWLAVLVTAILII